MKLIISDYLSEEDLKFTDDDILKQLLNSVYGREKALGVDSDSGYILQDYNEFMKIRKEHLKEFSQELDEVVKDHDLHIKQRKLMDKMVNNAKELYGIEETNSGFRTMITDNKRITINVLIEQIEEGEE